MRRVVVTGAGIVSPVGLGVDSFWSALAEGKPNFQTLSRFDPVGFSCQIAAQVTESDLDHLVEPRKVRTTPHVTRLALAAAELVLQDARIPRDAYSAHEIGVCMGTALGGWADAEQQCGVLLEKGARRVNPFIASGAGNHGPASELAGLLRAQGPQATFSSGCASSLQAIGHAASLIADGSIDACIAGGAESPINPLTFASLGRTNELATETGDPQKASRPFDRMHSGIVLSEGSALLFLEEASLARARGARIYCEVLGFTSSCDGLGLYGVDETGIAGARAIHRLLTRSEISPKDLDYVCAHANSSPAFDCKEVSVLTRALGEFLARVPVSSIKGVLGHPFGASGAFQTVATMLAMTKRMAPPTHNLDDPDPRCCLDHVRDRPREIDIRYALVTSYGYGGVNAYLLLGLHHG